MFKLAILSTLATSAVNAVNIEADADRHPWARPPLDYEGPYSRHNHRNIEADYRLRLGRIGGLRRGYGGHRRAPRHPRDDGPEFGLKDLAPLRMSRQSRASLRALKALDS